MNLVNPRYLGPALTPGAIYVASVQEGGVEVMCFKGNLSSPEDPASDDTSSEESDIAVFTPSGVVAGNNVSMGYGRPVSHAYSSSADSLTASPKYRSVSKGGNQGGHSPDPSFSTGLRSNLLSNKNLNCNNFMINCSKTLIIWYTCIKLWLVLWKTNC